MFCVNFKLSFSRYFVYFSAGLLNMGARSVEGIKYLKKDHLLYELRIRNESQEGSVSELCRRLRGALGKPVNISVDTVGEVSTAAAACRALLCSLQDGITLLEGTSPSRSQVSRLHALADHIANRVRDVRAVDGDLKVDREVQTLLDEVVSVQQHLSHLQCEGGSEIGEDQGDGAGGLSMQADASSPFSKLPNPLLPMINDVRVLSIDNVSQIVEVLWLLVRLEEQADALRVPHSVICQLILPLAQGRLNRLVAEMSRGACSLGTLRKTIVFDYLGARVRKDLVDRYFYRVQATRENLADYIERVRVALKALSINISEEEAVMSIVEGMRPQDRSRVLFVNKPQSFVDLDKIVVSIENVRYGDEKRDSGESFRDRAGVSAHVRSAARRACFRCGSEEHLVRECREPRWRRGDM